MFYWPTALGVLIGIIGNNNNNKVFIVDAKISQVHNRAVHIKFDIKINTGKHNH